MANQREHERERQAAWVELERTRLPELRDDDQECLREMARVTTNPVGYYLALVEDYAGAAAKRPEDVARWRRHGIVCLTSDWRETLETESYAIGFEYPGGAANDEAFRRIARRRVGGLLAAAAHARMATPVSANTDGWE